MVLLDFGIPDLKIADQTEYIPPLSAKHQLTATILSLVNIYQTNECSQSVANCVAGLQAHYQNNRSTVMVLDSNYIDPNCMTDKTTNLHLQGAMDLILHQRPMIFQQFLILTMVDMGFLVHVWFQVLLVCIID
mmetsp:Transcript_6663/g.12308  ORF Transcript_6663/g.12308 Transcript_6663/m.12308 type:complete len:133 (+) Transcript_6663:97-495(+)